MNDRQEQNFHNTLVTNIKIKGTHEDTCLKQPPGSANPGFNFNTNCRAEDNSASISITVRLGGRWVGPQPLEGAHGAWNVSLGASRVLPRWASFKEDPKQSSYPTEGPDYSLPQTGQMPHSNTQTMFFGIINLHQHRGSTSTKIMMNLKRCTTCTPPPTLNLLR